MSGSIPLLVCCVIFGEFASAERRKHPFGSYFQPLGRCVGQLGRTSKIRVTNLVCWRRWVMVVVMVLCCSSSSSNGNRISCGFSGKAHREMHNSITYNKPDYYNPVRNLSRNVPSLSPLRKFLNPSPLPANKTQSTLLLLAAG